jgi:hypothetical protein
MRGNLSSVGVYQRGFNRGFDERHGGFGKDYPFENKCLVSIWRYITYVNIVYKLSR